jgi:hypothetical protein
MNLRGVETSEYTRVASDILKCGSLYESPFTKSYMLLRLQFFKNLESVVKGNRLTYPTQQSTKRQCFIKSITFYSLLGICIGYVKYRQICTFRSSSEVLLYLKF